MSSAHASHLLSPDQAVSMSQLEQIAQAWQLHQAGALSIDEYAGMKAKILSAKTMVLVRS